MEITLRLTAEEINAVMQVLGNLPTSSGAYPLLVKMKMQVDEQTKPAESAQ